MTRPVPTRPPFSERGGRLRGLLDLSTGRYPAFLFGGPVGATLPVFHLHESQPATLDARLRYLSENGYRTVTSDAIGRLVRDAVHPGPRTVALCFDDAWASLWTIAAPLLERYGFSAITFAIPSRIRDAETLRPTLREGVTSDADDLSDTPFVTWPELRALHASGTIDVQSHSFSHSMIFSAAEPEAFVSPAFRRVPLLNRPRKAGGQVPFETDDAGSKAAIQFLTTADLGAPLYPARSRLSDAWRYVENPDLRERCLDHVRRNGGALYFDRPDWEPRLREVHGAASGRFESGSEREAAIVAELDRSRSTLASRLGSNTIEHVCAPWGIAGEITRHAARTLGFATLFGDRLFGRRSIRAGDDPYSLMRLHERFISCLPGRGRRYFHSAA